MTTIETAQTAPAGKGWTIGLWVAQILLAAFFGMSGGMHAFMSADALIANGVAWVANAPMWLVRFIGIAELAGTAGIILPALTRIMPRLTPLAALGFTAIQVLAMPVHIMRGEIPVLPVNLLVIAIALFVFWGRTRKAPISPRA